VAQDQRALGEAAVAALRGLLDAGPATARTAAESHIVPTRLLVRGSSRPPEN